MSSARIPSFLITLETERLLLRKIVMEDVDDIFEYASIPEVAEFVIWSPHKTKDDSIQFVNLAEQEFLNKGMITWGIELKSENKLIGSISIHHIQLIHSCAEIGYALHQKYWGKGLVTEAMKEILRFGFNVMNFNRLEAYCEEKNVGSWRVMEKCGMKYEGTFREKVFVKNRFRTMKMYSILKKEFSG